MAERKEQIKEFLKGCRARLDPADVGLRGPCRRRSPGLRREDVAALAGVSVTWYTWLEQGRDINVSADVLERVCASLRLSRDEREYLFTLVHGRPAPPLSAPDQRLSETLWRTIQYLPVPAVVITLRWDILVWNCLATRVLRDYGEIPPHERNLLRIILTDEKYQRDSASFETLARRLLAKFRVDFSQYAGDPAFEDLIADLRARVTGFEDLWKRSEISNAIRGSGIIDHEQLGPLSFEYSSYVPEGSSFLRLVMFVPADAKTAAALSTLQTEDGCPAGAAAGPTAAAADGVRGAPPRHG